MTRTSTLSSTRSNSGRGARFAPDYTAHPFLDPDFARRDPHSFRAYARILRDNLRNPWRYQSFLNKLLHPVHQEHPLEVNERILASYLRDASAYVTRMAWMLPPPLRDRVLPDSQLAGCNDLRQLVEQLFAEEDTRKAFEVRRKLYLTKLLLQIDRTRRVQDGPRHERYLHQLLEKEVWAYVKEARDEEVSYVVDDNGVRLSDALGTGGDHHWYRFGVRRVVRDLPGGPYDLPIYHFSTRFKRDAAPAPLADGEEKLPHLTRTRSASVLSKMLRKNLNDPVAITDMLGARFIVDGEREVHLLADFLHQVLGGPLAFRNQVDLFRRPDQHSRLNRFSSPSFRVFKEEVDILYAPQKGEATRPYLFVVEVQIFTVESYLRTLHSRDLTSHRRYKRRQVLEGVLPYLFPASLYGSLRLGGSDEGEDMEGLRTA